MGAILKGRDPDLGRDVAIKVLREDHRDNDDMVRRFVEEAQISGQLQHPGIAPIYELGAFRDNRPFFSMKLVKGDTLAKLLEARKGPADGLPRFLAIFESIAQTVAYSHARGVIHRDLKPSNVMVGSFGEVQVMDWGLAKVLPRGGIVDDAAAGKNDPQESVIATARSESGDSDLSHAGSVLGTPSYMAPEQARGEIDRIDERADVFSLGSILCEILTGRPAFVGRVAVEIQRKAARGDLADAMSRLDASGSEAELVALAKDCLAPDVGERPRNADEVADRITAYLSGVQARLQSAERERAVAVARAIEERRRRQVQLALAASILALVSLGGLGAATYFQQRQARAATVARWLGEAETLLARAAERPEDPSRWREAKAAAARVDAGLAGDEAATARLAKARSDAEVGLLAAERDAGLRQALMEVRVARIDVGLEQTDEAYARAFRDAGLDFEALDVAEAAARLKQRPPAVVMELVSYLDHWVIIRSRAGRQVERVRKLREIAIAADRDPYRSRIRTILASEDGQARASELKALANDPRSGEQSGPTTVLLAASFDDIKLGIAVLRTAVVRHPDDVWLNFTLAETLNRLSPPPLEEVIRYYTAARTCHPEVGSNLAIVLENLGGSRRPRRSTATWSSAAPIRSET